MKYQISNRMDRPFKRNLPNKSKLAIGMPDLVLMKTSTWSGFPFTFSSDKVEYGYVGCGYQYKIF